MKNIFFAFIFLLSFLWAPRINGAMSGGDYSIPIDAFTIFEDGTMSGGDFQLYDSGGNSESGTYSGGDFVLWGGFLQTSSGTLSFSLDKNTINFGELSLNSVSSDAVVATVSVSVDTGYTLSISEDGNLRTVDGLDIDDVVDGVVTIGSEEYGISTTGDDGILVVDTAVGDNVEVAYSASEAVNQATTINFETAISINSRAGNYSHIVTFTATTNP